MVTVPEYLRVQTESEIIERMRARVPAGKSFEPNGFLYDAAYLAVLELIDAAVRTQLFSKFAFISQAEGQYLDLKAEEHGLTREAATPAVGSVTFTGTNGTVIPAGTRVMTESVGGESGQVYSTDAVATITSGTTVTVPVTAEAAGSAGNVDAGAVTLLVAGVPGITGITNALPLAGGSDTESDSELRARLLVHVKNPSAGGNRADYVRWANEVEGVGAVSVVPTRDGAGTVSVAVLDESMLPASETLVNAVQDYIAPQLKIEVESEALTVQVAHGVTTIDRADDTGTSKQMAYSASGEGELRQADLDALLPQEGVYKFDIRALVQSSVTGLVAVSWGVWNETTAAWAKTTEGGAVNATRTLAPNQMTGDFVSYGVDFYWNGADNLRAVIVRENTEANALIIIDRVVFKSAGSIGDGEGKAPIGAHVTVEPGEAVAIAVTVTLTYTPGYNQASVRQLVEEAVDAYLLSLAFQTDNDVRYTKIADAILDVPGVTDYAGLTVNGGVVNIPIGVQEVAVPGTYTIT